MCVRAFHTIKKENYIKERKNFFKKLFDIKKLFVPLHQSSLTSRKNPIGL